MSSIITQTDLSFVDKTIGFTNDLLKHYRPIVRSSLGHLQVKSFQLRCISPSKTKTPKNISQSRHYILDENKVNNFSFLMIFCCAGPVFIIFCCCFHVVIDVTAARAATMALQKREQYNDT